MFVEAHSDAQTDHTGYDTVHLVFFFDKQLYPFFNDLTTFQSPNSSINNLVKSVHTILNLNCLLIYVDSVSYQWASFIRAAMSTCTGVN